MNARWILWVSLILAVGACAATGWAQQPFGETRDGFAADNRAAMGFAYPHTGQWYGSRRLGGMYEDQWPTDLYSRKVEHGAYNSSHSQYGFPLGIGLAAGFADVAARPVGEGFPQGMFSPWYQYPYYWNSNTAGPVNAVAPYPGMSPWWGNRPWGWGGGGWGVNPWAGGGWGGNPWGGGGWGGNPWAGGGGWGGNPWGGGGFPGGFPGGMPQPMPQSGPTFW